MLGLDLEVLIESQTLGKPKQAELQLLISCGVPRLEQVEFY